jgi:flavin reductase (DIM6/NTAB) family NADH-FMN oxidoreductase RutF
VPEPHDDPESFDRLRRRVLWLLPTGLYVVGSRAGERVNLMTANLVMQVSITPKLVAVSVEAGSVTAALMADGGGFTVSILDRRDRSLVRRFVKPADRVELDPVGAVVAIQGEPVRPVTDGLPVLDASLAWLACRLHQVVELGNESTAASHRLFIGEVVDAGEAPPEAGSVEGQKPEDGSEPEGRAVLRMEDTRMNYGG